jgi:membrane associated rhomboid family serine protease
MAPVAAEPPSRGDPSSVETPIETCYRHPNEQTRVHCTRCGRPICPECMIPAPVGHHCPECVAEARQAFRQSPASRVRTLAGTSMTKLLLVTIAVVFVIELVKGGTSRAGLAPDNLTLFQMGALFPPAVKAGQWWRLITVMFLHASILHIALNAWALWLFGQFVESSFGRLRFLSIYFLSGFLASVTSYAFGSPCQIGVGASGAIVGLLGAFIAYNFRRRHLSLAQANLRWALMIIGINVLFGAAIANVDNWAHGGGLVAGAALGTFAEGVGPRNIRPVTRVIGYVSVIAVGIALFVWRNQTFPLNINCFS